MERPGTGHELWWEHAVVYQVYLRSFADGNGDGTGDIAGLRSRLDYVQSLGVDAIWVNPWYRSPMNDGGYDVSDYRQIDTLFGTIDEVRDLVDECRDRGIRLLGDLVPNHTSSEHEWFQAALASPKGSAERLRYHFRQGRGEGGESPPNDWQSIFGGPAWSVVADGDWYLHLFDVTQPDLNWSNQEVRAEFLEILRFWLDMGLSGFRVDVANGLAKDPDYIDVGEITNFRDPIWLTVEHPFADRPELQEIVEEWRAVIDEYPGSILAAEAWVASWDRLVRYLRPGRYHHAFNFFFLELPWDAGLLRGGIDQAIRAFNSAGAMPTWVLSNHDVVRHATRYALPQELVALDWLLDGDRSILDAGRGLRRARAAALLVMGLPGSVYVFQGEELGLPEVFDLPPGALQDPFWERSGHTNKGRDGCRVPLPWRRSGPSFGFGSAPGWLPQPEDWGILSVEAQLEDDDSTLNLYKAAIRLRRELGLAHAPLEWVEQQGDVIAYRRGGIVCQVNFGPVSVMPVPGRVIISSGDATRELPPDTAIWVQASGADAMSD